MKWKIKTLSESTVCHTGQPSEQAVADREEFRMRLQHRCDQMDTRSTLEQHTRSKAQSTPHVVMNTSGGPQNRPKRRAGYMHMNEHCFGRVYRESLPSICSV